MYNTYKPYPCPYFMNTPMYNSNFMYSPYNMYPNPYWINAAMYNPMPWNQYNRQFMPLEDEMEDYDFVELKDYGPEPFVININEATKQNDNYRTALWTGDHLQVTLMSIDVGDDIGLEVHPTVDQFIRIEDGEGLVRMGDRKDNLDYEEKVYDDYAIMIPAGKWHNVINTGNKPLKVYSIYAPPQHPRGTVHETKAMAQAAEKK